MAAQTVTNLNIERELISDVDLGSCASLDLLSIVSRRPGATRHPNSESQLVSYCGTLACGPYR